MVVIPGKLFESVITRRLCYYLDGGDLYSPAQMVSFGSTVHAIAVVTENLAIHQSPGFILVLRDVCKAFDKLWHLGPKYKLLHLGLPDPVERLLCVLPGGQDYQGQDR